MREMLEGLAARRAAEHMSDADIAAVRTELDRHFSQDRLRTGDAYLQSAGNQISTIALPPAAPRRACRACSAAISTR